MKKLLCATGLLIFTLILSSHPTLWGKDYDPDLAHRKYMVNLSRQMGVTCTHCHDVKNFKSQKMKAWHVAKKHMAVVEDLNKNHLKNLGVKEVNCYMCHRGKAVPDYKEKAGIMPN